MVGYVNDEVLDQGLDYITANGSRLDITYTQQATTYTEAVTTFTCGNDSVTPGSTVDGASSGRRIIIPAITGGSVTDTQTAGWWALTDGTSVLIAAGALSPATAVTNGGTFSLDAISITKTDPTT